MHNYGTSLLQFISESPEVKSYSEALHQFGSIGPNQED